MIGSNTVAGNDGDDIRVLNGAYYGTLSQNVDLTGNVVSGNGDSGIFFSAYARNAKPSTNHVYVVMSANQVTHNAVDGLRAYQNGNGVLQHFTLGTQDSITFNTGHGVNLSAIGAGTLFFTKGGATISGNGLTDFYTHPGGNIVVVP